MPANNISSFRLVGAVSDRIEDLKDDTPALVSLRINFSAGLRASVDAFIAGGGTIRSTRVMGRETNSKVSAKAYMVSMPVALRRHYKRYAKAQGANLSALYNTAMLALIPVPTTPAR